MNRFCAQKGLNGSSTAILGKPYGGGGWAGGGLERMAPFVKS